MFGWLGRPLSKSGQDKLSEKVDSDGNSVRPQHIIFSENIPDGIVADLISDHLECDLSEAGYKDVGSNTLRFINSDNNRVLEVKKPNPRKGQDQAKSIFNPLLRHKSSSRMEEAPYENPEIVDELMREEDLTIFQEKYYDL